MNLSDPGDCEINAMTMAAKHTTVPVPSILRVVHPVKCPPGWRYIIIRYIPGRTIEECWATLSWWRRFVVLWTLRRYVRQFRRIPLGNRPPGPIGDGPQVCSGPVFTEVYVCIGLPPSPGPTGADRNVRHRLAHARDLGHSQPTPKCPPGSHADSSFLKSSNTLPKTWPRSTHLCLSCSPTSTSHQEI